MTPVQTVLGKLAKVRPQGSGWMACCPAHEDQRQSLSVGAGKDGRVLLNCHAGCSVESIVSAVGLTKADLFPAETRTHAKAYTIVPPTPTSERPSLVESYPYTDEDGTVLYEVCRMHPKSFRQRRPKPDGSWEWTLGDVRRVLYQLPEVIEATAHERPVFLVEGEKDANTLRALGYCATTWCGGANGWRDEYAHHLRGATVYCLPDNDQPGRQAMQQAATALFDRKAVVKIVQLPGLETKQDVSDWLDQGHDLDELDELIGQTPVWHPDPANRTRWRLDELWANDNIMRPPPAIVPRLAWAGRSTLLAAREKSGKSTLTGYIAAQVTRGGSFLNDPCERGDVLVVGLEEFVGDCARRLRHFGADPARIHLVDRFRGDPRERPQELRAHVEAVDPVLVILDSLAAYSQGQIQDDNNATQMTAVLQPLTDLAHEAGCGLLITHHARKSDGRSRGSTAITAAVDLVCEYSVPDEDADPTLRRMRSAGRVPVPHTYDLRYDGDTYVLTNGNEAPLDQRILGYLQSHPCISGSAVAEGLNVRRSDALTAIAKMIATGAILDLGDTKGRKLAVAGSVLPPVV